MNINNYSKPVNIKNNNNKLSNANLLQHIKKINVSTKNLYI